MRTVQPAPLVAIAMAVNLAAVSLCAASAPSPGRPHQSVDQLFQSVEGYWTQEIISLGGHYRAAKLQRETGPAAGTCTLHTRLSGPFYCPVNETVYLDQRFTQRLIQQDPTDADLTVGFIVAHEVAHHVQNVVGITGGMEQARANSTPQLAARLFTAFELQADCYAGLWTRWAAQQDLFTLPADPSRIVETVAATSRDWQSHLNAGEQMLDPLTLGTPAQRLRWFQRGLSSGNFNDCDTQGADAAGTL